MCVVCVMCKYRVNSCVCVNTWFMYGLCVRYVLYFLPLHFIIPPSFFPGTIIAAQLKVPVRPGWSVQSSWARVAAPYQRQHFPWFGVVCPYLTPLQEDERLMS